MEVTCDPAKETVNQEKHGVSLSLAETLEWSLALVKSDTRKSYGETGMIGYAPIAARVYCVVFVGRDDIRSIVSLRKANSREVHHYAEQI